MIDERLSNDHTYNIKFVEDKVGQKTPRVQEDTCKLLEKMFLGRNAMHQSYMKQFCMLIIHVFSCIDKRSSMSLE